MFSPFVDLLLLILIANGTPVIARNLFRDRFNWPLDMQYKLADRQPVLGPSKTWRGLLTSLGFTSFCAAFMGYEPQTGFVIALFSLLGDAVSSFFKRRLGKPSSSMFLLVDQIPESLLPALVLADDFQLSMLQVLLLVAIFVIMELILSNLFFKLGIRRKPY